MSPVTSTKSTTELDSSDSSLRDPQNGNGSSRAVSTDASAENTNDALQASLVNDASAPDGGYGWAVIFGCSVISFWIVGTVYSWGVMQTALFHRHLSSPSTLAFVGSLTCACISFLAVVNARLIRQLGMRATGLIGVSMLGLGSILSGFTTRNVGGLFVTEGLVLGIGVSLCFMLVSVAPAQYFKAKRGLANGIVCGAGGLGGAAISLSMDAVIQSLSPEWTFWILGSTTLATGLPAAWLIRERVPMCAASPLFRDVRFTLLFIAGAVTTFPLFVAPFFLPLYSHALHLSSRTGASLVAAFNFSSAVGRLMSGVSCDALGPINTLFANLLLGTVSTLVLWPLSKTLHPLVAFVILNGMANGGFFASIPTVVGNVFGSARVSVAMSMIVTGWAGGYLMGAPIAGYILTASGGENGGSDTFRPSIFWAGGMTLLSAVLVGCVRLKTDRDLLKKF
ncbi:hypothetical protein FQN55_006684 [Onygenales sp. PD_40]|nr:hypothetical protein FQN55_006684 [Onygenales sp. PD_40]